MRNTISIFVDRTRCHFAIRAATTNSSETAILIFFAARPTRRRAQEENCCNWIPVELGARRYSCFPHVVENERPTAADLLLAQPRRFIIKFWNSFKCTQNNALAFSTHSAGMYIVVNGEQRRRLPLGHANPVPETLDSYELDTKCRMGTPGSTYYIFVSTRACIYI